MDLSKIDGFEFEEYIATLFINKGFQVQKTNYAHDGGIDLIAVYNEPIFCGKYIIQCKKYEGTLVGQPIIRDLYGVVMSENANKGILITTSDFTEEARNFAKNKNIELIDGMLLKKIISNTVDESENGIDVEGFNSDRYKYLMDKICENYSVPKYYEETISFLKEYVISDASFVESFGLLDKIVKSQVKCTTFRQKMYK